MDIVPVRGLTKALAAAVLGLVVLPAARAEDDPHLPPVRWDADAAVAGRRVEAAWPAAVQRAQDALGAPADLAGAEVHVVRGLARMRAVARASVPAWAAGATIAGTRIVLRADPEAGASTDLEATLRHEAVHLVWARLAGPRVRVAPLWFEEGLAELVGGSPTLTAGPRLGVATGIGSLLEFETLESRWPDAALQADLAYQQSRRWLDVLVADQGAAAPGAVLRRALVLARDGAPEPAFERALLEVTGHPLSDWHADWRQSLSAQGRRWWLWFLTDLGGVLLAALALIGGATFWALRRRRRRQIEALPDEAPPGAPPEDL